MNQDREDDRGFKVTDRRQFDAEGQVRSDAPPKEPPRKPEPVLRPQPGAGPERTRDDGPATQPPADESDQIDFQSFVLSLATSALMYMGEVPSPDTGRREVHLEAARQNIDILSMLQAKTRGNLTPEESRLLDSALYELRMKYVAKTQQR